MDEKVIIDCPNCSQRLFVPSGSGTLSVTCPGCRSRWDWPGEAESIADETSTVAAGKEPPPIGSPDAKIEHPRSPVPKTNIDKRIERFVPKPPPTAESCDVPCPSEHELRLSKFINQTIRPSDHAIKSARTRQEISELQRKGYYVVVMHVENEQGERFVYILGTARSIEGAQAIRDRHSLEPWKTFDGDVCSGDHATVVIFGPEPGTAICFEQFKKSTTAPWHALQSLSLAQDIWFKGSDDSVYYFPRCFFGDGRPTSPAIYGFHAQPNSALKKSWILCEVLEKMAEITRSDGLEIAKSGFPELAAEVYAIDAEQAAIDEEEKYNRMR